MPARATAAVAPVDGIVVATAYWGAGTARPSPRLLKGRARVPVFVTHWPARTRQNGHPACDVCPDTGFAR
ncbi:hypothetical protein [Streptomyces sp. NBC_00316]|uniref:hypothetical protein n=1 Tax=Streptomyces sp. NBC_00316 TaxID=2975710 RepID=UPI002E29327F|nr:hypothetical protein [Streptomyces sp. NBC_00316]